MQLKLRLTLEEDGQFVCFKHAVQHAMKGDIVDAEIDTQGDGNDMRSWHCHECADERRDYEDYDMFGEEPK